MRDSGSIREPSLPCHFLRSCSLLVGTLFCLLMSVVAASADDESPRREVKRSLPLPPRLVASESVQSVRGKDSPSANQLWSTVVSLGLVVGAIVLVGRGLKWYGVRAPQTLPVEAFQVLGRRMIEPRVAVQLVKCGSRILVLGVGPEGVRTLAEVDDQTEVRELTEACLGTSPHERPNDSAAATVTAVPKPRSTLLARRAMLLLAGLGLTLSSLPIAEAQTHRTNPPVKRAKGGAPAQPVVREETVSPVEPAKSETSLVPEVDVQQFVSPQQLGLSLKMLALMTVFSLAPSILMMTTSFVRFTVALGLLRQALGTQQGPPNQVLTAICLFLTFLVMSPVWQRCYDEGIRPYTNPAAGETAIDESTALSRTIAPVRTFMSQQIEKSNNGDAVWMLLDYQRPAADSAAARSWNEPQSYDDVPLSVLAPAYLLSELKVGFLIGFQLFLPFLVIDLVVAMVLTSLGLTMMPPSMVSLPFKLLLFVMIDGWFLTVGMLLESVRTV